MHVDNENVKKTKNPKNTHIHLSIHKTHSSTMLQHQPLKKKGKSDMDADDIESEKTKHTQFQEQGFATRNQSSSFFNPIAPARDIKRDTANITL